MKIKNPLEKIIEKARAQERERMTGLKAQFAKMLDEDMGVPNSTTRLCYLVIHDGRATIIEHAAPTMNLEDLYAAPEKVGAKRIDTVGHQCVGETWEGRKIDMWFDDEGLLDPDRAPCLIEANHGHTICGPVVVTSSNEAGETVPLTIEEAISLNMSANLYKILPVGLPWKKPGPRIEVVSMDEDETVNPN